MIGKKGALVLACKHPSGVALCNFFHRLIVCDFKSIAKTIGGLQQKQWAIKPQCKLEGTVKASSYGLWCMSSNVSRRLLKDFATGQAKRDPPRHWRFYHM